MTTKSLRAAYSAFDAFENALSQLKVQREQLLANHRGLPDEKTAARLQMLDAQLSLAAAARQKEVDAAREALRQGLAAESELISRLSGIHDRIDAAIIAHVRSKVDDDLAEAVDGRNSKSFKTEQVERYRPIDSWYDVPKLTAETLRSSLQSFIPKFEEVVAEFDRCVKVGKKFGADVTA